MTRRTVSAASAPTSRRDTNRGAAPAAPAGAERRGRPSTDTVGLHLRLARELDDWLQDRAIEESGRVRKTVTKQAVILRILEKARKAAR